jgi:hypothetical protein
MDIREKILELFRQKCKVELEKVSLRIGVRKKLLLHTTQDLVIFAVFKYKYSPTDIAKLVGREDFQAVATSIVEILNSFYNEYGTAWEE